MEVREFELEGDLLVLHVGLVMSGVGSDRLKELVVWLCRHADGGGRVVLGSAVRRSICDDMGIYVTVLSNYIRRLRELGYVVRYDRKELLMSPVFFFGGRYGRMRVRVEIVE